MAASLTNRTGMPSALLKLKPTHFVAKCFGFRTIRPVCTGAGKPIDATSNFQPRTVSLNLATNCSGLIRGPEGNSRSSRRDISSFTDVPPTSTTRIFFFISERPRRQAGKELLVAPEKTREEALFLRFCRRARRPAFHDFERKKPEQQLLRRFQIEPQVLGNLLDGSGTIELRCELRLV